MIPLRIFQSINFRLALLYAAVFGASVLVLGAFLYLSTSRSLESQLRTRILSETEQLMGDYHDDGLDELRHDIRERTQKSRAHRLLYALKGKSGKILFDDIAIHEQAGWHTQTSNEGDRLLVFTTILADGYSLHVGTDLGDVAAMNRALRNSIAMVLLVLALLGITGGIIVSRRFLARVDRLTRATESIGRGSLSARLPVSSTRDDFDQLAITINHMLERIEQLMDEVKHVSTSIAHDMRTPLGKLRQKLEALANHTHDAYTKQELDESIDVLDDTLRTFTSLLRIAEIESGNLPLQQEEIDLAPLFARLGDTYSAIAEENGQALEFHSTAGHIHADKALLVQMLVNLIENALRHSGKGSRITVEAAGTTTALLLTVRDNGPGIPETEHAYILRPFYRLDRSRNTHGSGLGLSLVNAIASLHGATLTLKDNRPGLTVTIRFAR